MEESEVFYEVLPSGWWTLAVVAFGFVIALALLVMLLVSGSKFHDPAGSVATTPGPCYPFCTAIPALPAPALAP
ncbi:hypothetical protein [Nocardia sp. alder85J]|uniref:hypothetical protein n=1 Tax=Nocardia sp. alder85J TaxID=2862949 RepID=UPI001CD1E922|nr:hypothetical protein [Nocardia sp. alder85J]MCX4096036.1 hypothetical protein [Nocardia sp. alder85J]